MLLERHQGIRGARRLKDYFIKRVAMDVSVIIVNYNTYQLTSDCIQSIIDKTCGCTFEIIVVDNASHERSASHLQEVFPQVKVISNTHNMGFAAANNIGIKVASGDYILLLNSDTELVNNAILHCLTTIRTHGNIGAIGCRLKFPDGKIQHNCQRFPAARYKTFELLRLQKILPATWCSKFLLGPFFSYDFVVQPDWIWGTFFMVRRDIIELMPEQKLADDFFMYVEDMQWCKDIQRLGYRIAFEPKAVVIHYMGKSNANKPVLMEQNMDVFMRRHYSPLKLRILNTLDKMLEL